MSTTALHPRQLSLLVVTTVALGAQHRPIAAHQPAAPPAARFGAIAPAFVRNSGQTNPDARFLAVGGGRPIFFTASDVRIVDPRRQRSFWLTWVDGAAVSVDGESPTG